MTIDTQILFPIVIALASGYGLAFFFTNLSDFYRRYGLLISYFIVPASFVGLLFLSASISDQNNIILSSCYLIAFMVRMIRHD